MRTASGQVGWALGIFAISCASCAAVSADRKELVPADVAASEKSAEQCADRGALPTTGLYVVTPLNRPVPESVLKNPDITGIAVRVGWKELQPTAQEPLFTLIDEQLAAARRHQKKVSLSIEAGIETPEWVYALGARPFSVVLDEKAGERACQKATLPVPWDPVYLDSFRQLIVAASRRYNRSHVLAHVKVTGIGGSGPTLAVPHGAPRKVLGPTRACETQDEVALWLDIGYSRARIESTWRDLINLFAQSFSAHRLSVVVDTEGFPPIGEAGQLLPALTYDPELVPELLKWTLLDREKRVMVQSNKLSDSSDYPFPIQISAKVTVGYQFLHSVTRDARTGTERAAGAGAAAGAASGDRVVASFDETVRRGVLSRAQYLEISMEDATDRRLASSLAGARVLLRGAP